MRTVKITIECEVPDSFNNMEALNQFISRTFDNTPEPEVMDENLKDVFIGINYKALTQESEDR